MICIDCPMCEDSCEAEEWVKEDFKICPLCEKEVDITLDFNVSAIMPIEDIKVITPVLIAINNKNEKISTEKLARVRDNLDKSIMDGLTIKDFKVFGRPIGESSIWFFFRENIINTLTLDDIRTCEEALSTDNCEDPVLVNIIRSLEDEFGKAGFSEYNYDIFCVIIEEIYNTYC